MAMPIRPDVELQILRSAEADPADASSSAAANSSRRCFPASDFGIDEDGTEIIDVGVGRTTRDERA